MKRILIFLCFFAICLFSCNNNHKGIAFIGYEIVNISEEEYNQEFLFKKIESKTLLKLIDNDGKNESTKTRISTIFKKSKTLFLSIGYYDLMKNVELKNGNLSFNFRNSILELFELNLVNIIDCIYEFKKDIKINIFSLYNPYFNDNSFFYKDYELGVDKYNEIISGVCKDNRCNYLDISFVSKKIDAYNQISDDSIIKIKELIRSYE